MSREICAKCGAPEYTWSGCTHTDCRTSKVDIEDSEDPVVIDEETLRDWRINYELHRDPHDLTAYWRNYCPIGAVLALKAAVEEIESLRGLLSEAKTDRLLSWRANGKLLAQLAEVRELVDKQAEDEGLWCIAETAAEAYLQQELRRLHAAIEGE